MFCLFFCYFMSQWLKNEIFSFFRTLAFLFGQSCLYVTFTSSSTPSFGMLLLKLSNKNTHVCTFSMRMISFFLPFSVNCSQVAMFQIMPALCPHGQGEGFVNLMCTDLDRRRGGPKISQICEDILYG